MAKLNSRHYAVRMGIPLWEPLMPLDWRELRPAASAPTELSDTGRQGEQASLIESDLDGREVLADELAGEDLYEP